MWRGGARCVRTWRRGASPAASSAASGGTRSAISRAWSKGASSYFCRPSFFPRQVLLDRLGGDLVGDRAELELVLSEQVGIVGGGEVGGQLVDLGIDGLADGSREVLDLGLLCGRQRCGRHRWTPVPGPGFPRRSPFSLLCTKIPPTFEQLSDRGELLIPAALNPGPAS